MRVLIIGGTGVIGAAVARTIGERHEAIVASRRGSPQHVDITDADSIRALFASVGVVDAVVCAAGSAKFAPLASLTDADFAYSVGDKLMGQVNVVRTALRDGGVRDGGSVTVTSGVLAQQPMVGAAAISMVNAGLEGFVRGAALEAPRGIRVNVVSPGWVAETLAAMGQDPSKGIPAADVARVYLAAVEGSATGQVLAAVRR